MVWESFPSDQLLYKPGLPCDWLYGIGQRRAKRKPPLYAAQVQVGMTVQVSTALEQLVLTQPEVIDDLGGSNL